MIYWQIFWLFFRLSLMAFGGMLGVLPEAQHIVVDEYHWMSADDFVQSFVVGQFVPGPNMAMTALVGYRVAGVLGALAATSGVYFGPVVVVGTVSGTYYRYRSREWVRRCEQALRPLVFGLIGYSVFVFLRQQVGQAWLKGLIIGLPIAYLNWKEKLSALPAIILTGALWWSSWFFAHGLTSL